MDVHISVQFMTFVVKKGLLLFSKPNNSMIFSVIFPLYLSLSVEAGAEAGEQPVPGEGHGEDAEREGGRLLREYKVSRSQSNRVQGLLREYKVTEC